MVPIPYLRDSSSGYEVPPSPTFHRFFLYPLLSSRLRDIKCRVKIDRQEEDSREYFRERHKQVESDLGLVRGLVQEQVIFCRRTPIYVPLCRDGEDREEVSARIR